MVVIVHLLCLSPYGNFYAKLPYRFSSCVFFSLSCLSVSTIDKIISYTPAVSDFSTGKLSNCFAKKPVSKKIMRTLIIAGFSTKWRISLFVEVMRTWVDVTCEYCINRCLTYKFPDRRPVPT